MNGTISTRTHEAAAGRNKFTLALEAVSQHRAIAEDLLLRLAAGKVFHGALVR